MLRIVYTMLKTISGIFKYDPPALLNKKVNRIDLSRKPLTCCFEYYKYTDFLLLFQFVLA